MNPTERLGDALAELDEEYHEPCVFKEDGEWVVLSFGPFERRTFPSWVEAYHHAYTIARIPVTVVETIQAIPAETAARQAAAVARITGRDAS